MTLADQRFALVLAAMAVLGCGWAPAAADPVPGYPASTEMRDVLPWLAQNTSVRPADIVATTPQAVVSLDGVMRGSDKAAPIVATLREQVIDAELGERLHIRSARAEVELDCAANVFRIRETTKFALPDLKGDMVKQTSSANWSRLEEGSATIQRVAQVVCGTGSVGPGAKAANVVPPPAIRAPAPAKVQTVPMATRAAAPPAPPPPAAANLSRPASAGPSFLVRLGSYSTPDNAHTAVAALTRGFPGPIKGRDVVVRKSSVGGRDYFVVAVEGFAGRADAAAFCKAIHAAPADCLIRP